MTDLTNELRLLAQAATPGPWKMLPVGDGRQKFAVANSEFLSILTVTDEGGATFGTVYDAADARFIAAANPAVINELLDRLERAEKERTVDEQRIADLMAELNRVGHENDALRAKIAEMEWQEPVAQSAPSICPAALSPVIKWLRNGCDPRKAADELEILTATPEAKP